MRTFKYALAALAAASLFAAGPALAHARLMSSTPADHATVSAAPSTLTLTFNERIVPAFSKVELAMPAHGMNMEVTSRVSEDGKSLIATPAHALTKGAYRITWSAASADGHKMSGVVNFTVG